MKAIFIDTSATREYILPFENMKGIVWTLASLDSPLVLHILTKFKDVNATDEEKVVAQLTEFARFGIRGAKDAETGKPFDEVQFEEVSLPYIGKRTVLSESVLRRLRVEVLLELGKEVRRDNVVTDEERKKSSGL